MLCSLFLGGHDRSITIRYGEDYTVSFSFMRQFAGAAAATAAGMLLLAGPAHATAKATAAEVSSDKATPSAAVIAANNAAVIASLPPNVTMKVIGTLPELQGPTYHYVQGGPTTTSTSDVTIFALKTLPYNFTFTHVNYFTGESSFKSTKTVVCKDIQVWENSWGENKDFRVWLNGGSVKVPFDNVARSYCWSGVPTNKELRFTYGFADLRTCGECTQRYVDGKGRVRYA